MKTSALTLLCSLPALTAIAACNSGSVEFHELRIQDSVLSSRPPENVIVTRSFVVANVPKDTDSLAISALSFARRYARNPDFPSYWVSFNFYRETRYTPRDFLETDERDGKIHDHGEDYLMAVTHTGSEARECWFVSIKGRDGQSPLDTCVDLAPMPVDSAMAAPATSSMETP